PMSDAIRPTVRTRQDRRDPLAPSRPFTPMRGETQHGGEFGRVRANWRLSDTLFVAVPGNAGALVRAALSTPRIWSTEIDVEGSTRGRNGATIKIPRRLSSPQARRITAPRSRS